MHHQQPAVENEFFPKHLLEACIVTRAVALSGAFLDLFLY
jgi:hypothetical protein